MTKSNEQVDFTQDIWLLAEQNGLQIRKESMEINESGMDFRVAFATDISGQKWVLRQPRREDVWGRAENERRVLDVVRGVFRHRYRTGESARPNLSLIHYWMATRLQW